MLKATIIGVRIILFITVLAGIGYGVYSWYEDKQKEEKELVRKELVKQKIKTFSPIGTWFYEDSYKHILNFYSDSTFTDSQSGMIHSYDNGNYILYEREGNYFIKMNFNSETKVFRIDDLDTENVWVYETGDRYSGNRKWIKR